MEHITELEPETEDNKLNVRWEWAYGEDGIKTEEEYFVLVVVKDNNGNTWTNSAESIVFRPVDDEVIISSEIMQVFLLICIIVIIGILVAYKLFLGKYLKSKIMVLSSNTSYFYEYKLLIAGEVLHSLAWYLLLVISLFIFQAAWTGWGDFLVGVNYGAYQIVPILLFLILAKGSDVRGKRKNMLLSLVLIGAVILFIMAWLSALLATNPYILLIIIILFTIFVLCYYGSENLELVLVTEYFPENYRGKAFGLMKAVGNIGGLVGGVLSGLLFDVVGFWFCFLLAGFAMLLSFFVMFRLKDVGVVEEEISVNAWLRNMVKGVAQLGGKMSAWFGNVLANLSLKMIDEYLFGFKNRKQMLFLFYTTLFTLIAYGMIVPFIMVFLSEARGESATTLGIVYTVFGVALFLPINQMLAGWCCDRYTARKVYIGAIFAYIGLWGIFNLTIPLFTSNVMIMIVFIFPVWPFLWIGFKMFVADLTPRNERVRGITSIRLALGIGIVIGSISGGFLLSFVSYETVFQLAMIFTFIAAGLALILLKITKVSSLD